MEYQVVSSYDNGWVTIGTIQVNISMQVIMEANDLSLEGILFKQNSMIKLKEIQTFFNPRESLVKKRTRINLESLLMPWNSVTKWVTRYFMLNDR